MFKAFLEKHQSMYLYDVSSTSIPFFRVIYFPKLGVYSASKFAVTALTETLRQELNAKGSKTKVTVIMSPLPIWTIPLRSIRFSEHQSRLRGDGHWKKRWNYVHWGTAGGNRKDEGSGKWRYCWFRGLCLVDASSRSSARVDGATIGTSWINSCCCSINVLKGNSLSTY